ncbi:hypothetical protein DF218_08495 [Streptococcus parasanguinis]|nr:hypothetical protein DF218_08495 [Streptococcus parasanguinis]
MELHKRTKIPINHCVLQLVLSNIKGWTVFAQPLSSIFQIPFFVAISHPNRCVRRFHPPVWCSKLG